MQPVIHSYPVGCSSSWDHKNKRLFSTDPFQLILPPDIIKLLLLKVQQFPQLLLATISFVLGRFAMTEKSVFTNLPYTQASPFYRVLYTPCLVIHSPCNSLDLPLWRLAFSLVCFNICSIKASPDFLFKVCLLIFPSQNSILLASCLTS